MVLPLHDNKKKGFVALISVILVGAAAVTTAVSTLIISTDAFQYAYTGESTSNAKAYATACGEVAINKLKANANYFSAMETINFPSGKCETLSISGSGNTNRIIDTRGTAGRNIKKIRITISTVNPSTVITSWQEVAN